MIENSKTAKNFPSIAIIFRFFEESSVQRAKSEDFRTEPKMSEEDRQKKLAEIKKKIEKENAENVLVLQRKWRCEQCRLAHPTTGKRFPEHRREGCYKTLKSNKI